MTDKNRRRFVSVLGASSVAVPLGMLVSSLPSRADDLPMVDPEEPQAKALSYVVQAEGEDNCAGCALYLAEADAEAGPCGVFPGKHVAGAGWCSAYVAKPS